MRSADRKPIDRIRGEAEIIAILRPLAAGEPGAFNLEDDAAALAPSPGCDFVVTTDAVASGVHFFEGEWPDVIAYRALAVNISDLAAKAARPRAYLMALALPEAPTRGWLAAFARGLAEAQAEFGCTLIGGDTDWRPGPTVIDITAIGEVPAGRMVRRGGARPGDRLFVSGTLGDAKLGLILKGGGAPERELRQTLGGAADAAPLIQRYVRPEPRLGLRAALLAHANAAMDVSDGLPKDLARMMAASGAAARVELTRLPFSTITRGVIERDVQYLEVVLTAGDDYEILASVPAGKAAAFAADARAAGVPMTEIGSVAGGEGVQFVTADGSQWHQTLTMGYDHF